MYIGVHRCMLVYIDACWCTGCVVYKVLMFSLLAVQIIIFHSLTGSDR